MEITVSGNVVTINGNIKTIGDFQEIKKRLDAMILSYRNITVEIKDLISMTSSVIGYFNKLVLSDKINLELKIGTDQLMSLFDDLNLSSTLKAVKV